MFVRRRLPHVRIVRILLAFALSLSVSLYSRVYIQLPRVRMCTTTIIAVPCTRLLVCVYVMYAYIYVYCMCMCVFVCYRRVYDRCASSATVRKNTAALFRPPFL